MPEPKTIGDGIPDISSPPVFEGAYGPWQDGERRIISIDSVYRNKFAEVHEIIEAINAHMANAIVRRGPIQYNAPVVNHLLIRLIESDRIGTNSILLTNQLYYSAPSLFRASEQHFQNFFSAAAEQLRRFNLTFYNNNFERSIELRTGFSITNVDPGPIPIYNAITADATYVQLAMRYAEAEIEFIQNGLLSEEHEGVARTPLLQRYIAIARARYNNLATFRYAFFAYTAMLTRIPPSAIEHYGAEEAYATTNVRLEISSRTLTSLSDSLGIARQQLQARINAALPANIRDPYLSLHRLRGGQPSNQVSPPIQVYPRNTGQTVIDPGDSPPPGGTNPGGINPVPSTPGPGETPSQAVPPADDPVMNPTFVEPVPNPVPNPTFVEPVQSGPLLPLPAPVGTSPLLPVLPSPLPAPVGTLPLPTPVNLLPLPTPVNSSPLMPTPVNSLPSMPTPVDRPPLPLPVHGPTMPSTPTTYPLVPVTPTPMPVTSPNGPLVPVITQPVITEPIRPIVVIIEPTPPNQVVIPRPTFGTIVQITDIAGNVRIYTAEIVHPDGTTSLVTISRQVCNRIAPPVNRPPTSGGSFITMTRISYALIALHVIGSYTEWRNQNEGGFSVTRVINQLDSGAYRIGLINFLYGGR